ncbi:hypothetical protein Clacol_006338 [Clathrus columnatus]|uniref:DH domain-containing protein n=1 Tax=Clathrus columnatus TaxID=1419009 RepID=A0AAV5AEF0_9AGAM|nr:hypothetical protein Clacol_006338 [Clathrus columnatus]
MKALFNRTFNRSSSLKDKDGKEAALAHSIAASLKTNSSSNLNANASHISSNSVPSLPPLPAWPPSSTQQRPLSSISQSSLKPLPEIVSQSRPLPPIFDEPESVDTSSVSGDVHVKSRDTFLTTGNNSGTRSNSNGYGVPQQQHKKVAFISPVSTPPSVPVQQSSDSNNSLSFERKHLTSAPDHPTSSSRPPFSPDILTSTSNTKTSQSVLRVTNPSTSSTSSPPNTLSSVSRSATSNSPTTPTTSITTTASRGLSLPFRNPEIPSAKEVSSTIRSGTPYSVMSANTSRILATASWSEAAEEDLVSNLGPRERTRQEVLWEIVASEERYVAELLKMKETFIDPLLHPFAAVPPHTPDTEYSSPPPLTRLEMASPIPLPSQESFDHLPIAARFLSPLSFDGPTIQQHQHQHPLRLSTPIIEGESDEEDVGAAATAAKMNHPRSPYRHNRSAPGTAINPNAAVNMKIGSGNSTPTAPTIAGAHPAVSSVSLDDRERDRRVHPSPVVSTQEQGQNQNPASRISRKLKKNQHNISKQGEKSNILGNSDAIPPHLLPDDLRRCLEVIETGIVNGHFLLSEGLRKRYEEQYPLVRSLADVFVSHSHILREYATYVLHLERALEQVDDALSLTGSTKRPKKQSEADWAKLSRYLRAKTASDKGETGLAISLSKPFQRLLKYPLLFQNLLFHTDPSTFEYESTLQMVAEVETIVRSIEDEKIQKEERDRTRDVFARIEGLDKIKQLAVPKPSRLLIEERVLESGTGTTVGGASAGPASRETGLPPVGSNSTGKPNSSALSTPPSANKNVKGKSSFRRLSDVLQSGGSGGIGGKKDLWLVVFNDVVLRCQRTGITSLPLSFTTAVSPPAGSASATGRTASLPDLGKTKYATTGRRNSHTKPRNLYKFIKIENWAMASDAGASVSDNRRVGIVSMEDISRSRAIAASGSPSSSISAVPGPSKPIITPMPEEDEDDMDSSDSDRKSKMSFSYWGADKVTLSHTVLNNGSNGQGSTSGGAGITSGNHRKAKTRAPLSRGTVRGRPIAPSSYTSRESSANAKFGSRLVGANVQGTGTDTFPPRPASRKAVTPNGSTRRTNASSASTTVTTTSSLQLQPDDPKITTGRPAWDGSTKAPSTASTTSVRRPRNISQTSTNPKVVAETVRTIKVSSSAPSEDSGVGLYRQIMAQDPSINR